MNKLFSSAAPLALTLAATLFCSAAHAQQSTGASQPQVSAAQNLSSYAANQQANGLTRAQVYDQLVQAEKDGSLANLNATVYKGN
jgi:parvulin-like peptidyl-prolyl isomerase